MTTDEVLAECARRGVRLTVDHEGRPHAQGIVSKTLLAVLRWHRAAIIERLPREVAPALPEPEPTRPRQWRWPGNLIMPDAAPGTGELPPGATHWRYWGEQEWQEVPR